jgi:uncharacterized protein with HEPN domain
MRPEARDAAYLKDMLDACREVEEFTKELDFRAFVRDRLACRAVERSLEIAGEAAKRVTTGFRDAHPEIQWRQIAGLRDILAHDYSDVDYVQLYKAVRQDVPPLLAALEAILSEIREASAAYRVARRRFGRARATVAVG